MIAPITKILRRCFQNLYGSSNRLEDFTSVAVNICLSKNDPAEYFCGIQHVYEKKLPTILLTTGCFESQCMKLRNCSCLHYTLESHSTLNKEKS